MPWLGQEAGWAGSGCEADLTAKVVKMKPEIQGTEFGKITVDEEVYEHDIVIRLSGTVKKRKKKLSKEIYGNSCVASDETGKSRPVG